MKRLLRRFSGRDTTARRPVESLIAARYQAFKCLLEHNRAALDRIARLEQLYYGSSPFGLPTVRIEYVALIESVYGIVNALEGLLGQEQTALKAAVEGIDDAIEQIFQPQHCPLNNRSLVLPFADIQTEMKPLVGAKAANLAVIQTSLGLPVPAGFGITAHACERFLADNGLNDRIRAELAQVIPGERDTTAELSQRLQNLVLAAEVPADLAEAILAGYARLQAECGPELRVAVRSSALGEDTGSTFAGQYATVLNVTGANLLAAYKEVLASKYSAAAICYRIQHGLDDTETPMAVAVVAMVPARASGVVYSRDPAQPEAPLIRVNALWGLGERLVDGSATPDVFLVERESLAIRSRSIADKPWQLTAGEQGGTELAAIPADEAATPSLTDDQVRSLADYCQRLEAFFAGPQDVEWASDSDGAIFLLQSRPLFLPEISDADKTRREFPEHPILLAQGMVASPGTASGRIWLAQNEADLRAVPRDAILVVRTAGPQYASLAGRIKGLIAEVGSASSHMASVAREFGLPAIVDAGDASQRLSHGEPVTLAASSATVYRGEVRALLDEIRPVRKLILESPLYRRLRAILDRISPLHLTDSAAASFNVETCSSLHDVIRYGHEMAVRAMFGLSVNPLDAGPTTILTTRLPLRLHLVDLGGGLSAGTGPVSPDRIASRPLRALWAGMTHPGVSWAGTMNTGADSLGSRLAATATADFGELPGGDSYALVSADYVNFSARFAYHFATVDALCGEHGEQNYISLQFAGGAGSYYGRGLRVELMAAILARLGFSVDLKGDLLDARFLRRTAAETGDRLDQLGRLLASCKLLDMRLSSPAEVTACSEAFFAGHYDFLSRENASPLPGFYLDDEHWQVVQEADRRTCLRDGAPFGRRLGTRLTGALARMLGSHTELLDNVAANHHFPLAVARQVRLEAGSAEVRIKLVDGRLDQVGGLAFAIASREDYHLFMLDALAGMARLYVFRDGRGRVLAEVRREIVSGNWYRLAVTIGAGRIEAGLDGEAVLTCTTDAPLTGYVGLWTKSDATTCFDALSVARDGVTRTLEI